ncbi:hypothetical protein [Yoonia sp. SDW83-1]|uniref:hypothetical protein n=1 Tax=Yoonia sp. SDW83-1 TaxID=3366945 RepID=UPI00398C2D4C
MRTLVVVILIIIAVAFLAACDTTSTPEVTSGAFGAESQAVQRTIVERPSTGVFR